MTREATCFQCRHVLRVSPDAPGRWLTCPRCLASVGNPNVLLAAAPPPAVVAPAPPLPEALPASRSCPWCHRDVDPDWRVCPRCGRTLQSERPNWNRASLDADVRLDSRGANVGALVLGVCLIVGTVLFVFLGVPSLVQTGDTGQVVFIGVLAIGAFLGGVIALAVGSRKKVVTVVSGVLGGVAAGVGVMLLIVVVTCMTIAAAFANFLHTCQCK